MTKQFFAVIFYTFYVFEGNYIELRKSIAALKQYVLDGNLQGDDGENYIKFSVQASRDLARLIHNYAAAHTALVDNSRAVVKHLENDTDERIKAFGLEYQKKLDETLKDTFENQFVKALRTYATHKAMPVPNIRHGYRRIDLKDKSAKSEYELSFVLETKDLQPFNWAPSPKKYIEENDNIPLESIINKHFLVVKEFYLWIQFREEQLNPYASSSSQQISFEEWKEQKSRS